jgi:Kef-type K+ transport system membrane component KefB
MSLFFYPILTLGLILVSGYFSGKAANFFRLPRISGYIVTGFAFSPSITGIIASQQIDDLFGLTSEIALAFIAYSIGGSLLISRVRILGKGILWITFTQGLGAFVCTCLAVYAIGAFLPAYLNETLNTFISVVLILGGISVATAPAATMAVLHELRAKGALTTTLLGVVALDDAFSIIIFSIITIIVSQLLPGSVDNSVILQGFITIAGAIAVGFIAGLIFSYFLDPSKRLETNLMLTLGAIFLVSGLSSNLGASPLLANMVMGFIIINKVTHADELFNQLEIIEETIFCLFFTLAAAHFDTRVFTTSALLGIVILIGRFIGKLSGTFVGGKISKTPPEIYKYLGITLLPQAGLSLGLIFLAKPIFNTEIFDLLLSAMLVSIILNEIISPPLVKWAITKVGENKAER